MSFLAPLFLLGALAIAGPVLFHLIRRTTRERTLFSSLLFLEPTPPRLTRRSRIEHWLLLALRCLALGLLALGFARPFFPKAAVRDPVSGRSKRVVLLVDTSASLRREGAWAIARDRALDWTRRLSDVGELALLTFDRTVQSRLGFADWKATPVGDRPALVRERLAAVEPGWAGTQLGTALMAAAETLTEPAVGPEPEGRQIVLISDLQDGSHVDSLQAYEWPKGVELLVDPVTVRPPGNAGLHLVTEENSAPPGSNAVVRVQISNTTDATREQFEVGWMRPEGTGFLGVPAKIYVPAGNSRTLALPVPDGEPVERIGLTGDQVEFDNAVFVSPPEVTRTQLLYVGADAAGEVRQPLFFLRRAFPEGSRPQVDWTTRKPTAFSATDATAKGLTIVADPVPAGSAAALREAVTAGGTLLFVLQNPSAAAGLGDILGVAGLAATEIAGGNYALLGEMDFRHPLFSPFADPRFSDFTKVRIWKHRRLDLSAVPGARVLARLDSGDPGLVEVPVGRGRVLVLTWGWHPEDSQWALSSKFVPFLHALLEYSGAVPPPALTQQVVGEPLALPAATLAGEWKIRLPDGSERLLPAGATNFADTSLPGIYRVVGPGAVTAMAVNLDPAESRTPPTAGDELERLGAPLGSDEPAPAEVKARRENVQAAEAETRQKLWRWFLIGTIVVLLLETVAAGWSARRRPAALEATA